MLDPCDERAIPPHIRRHHQHGVVASQRRDHFRERGSVDGHSEQRRFTRPGPQQHELLDAIDSDQILGHRPAKHGRSAHIR